MNGRPWPTATHVRHWLASSPFLLTASERADERHAHERMSEATHVTVAVASTRMVDISIVVDELVDWPTTTRTGTGGSKQERGWRPRVFGLWSLVAFHPRGLALSLCVWGTLVAAPTDKPSTPKPREREIVPSCWIKASGGIRGCRGFSCSLSFLSPRTFVRPPCTGQRTNELVIVIVIDFGKKMRFVEIFGSLIFGSWKRGSKWILKYDVHTNLRTIIRLALQIPPTINYVPTRDEK